MKNKIVDLFIGFKQTPEAMAPDQINTILNGLSQHFNLGVGAVLPMILVLVMLLKRCSPILSIIAGALCGVVVAVIGGHDR